MNTLFEIFGPYPIDYTGQKTGSVKRIDDEHVESFWNQAELSILKLKQGCYVFALQSGKGFTPWYVGKSTKGFSKECFQAHKTKHYNNVLYKGIKGKPVMFFACLGGTKMKAPAKVIDEMETYLIQSALFKNKEIRNLAKTKNVPTWGILGVIRSGKGRPSKLASTFSKLMGI